MIRGPKFCVTTKGNVSDFCGDTYIFSKKLMTHEKYFDKQWKDESLFRKPSKKYLSTSNKELSDIIATINKIDPKKIEMNSNVCEDEERGLRELQSLSKTTIEIKKADKSNTFVIMDKETYKEKLVLEGHLNTPAYEKVKPENIKNVYKDLVKLCEKYQTCITQNERKVILDEDWDTSKFYILPKINKCKQIIDEIHVRQSEYIHMPMPDDLTGRPIVGGSKSVTKGISKLLEKILTPLVSQLKTFIKDELDFLNKFPRNIGDDSYILCCDVKSLYTSIPNDLGLQALEYWVDKLAHLIPNRFTKSFILEFTKFVLENNYFGFEVETWRQILGTAMGASLAPPYTFNSRLS